MRHGGDPTLDALFWAVQAALNDAVSKLYSGDTLAARRLHCYAVELHSIVAEELDWRSSLEEDAVLSSGQISFYLDALAEIDSEVANLAMQLAED